MEHRQNEGAGETGDPRQNPLTNGIVRHDSHWRKFGDPAGDWTPFASVGGEQSEGPPQCSQTSLDEKLSKREESGTT
ncbi:hypothetical protein PR048_021144 [Dryococelus australis]|uniref:Uncharacterized protein n=1 Tax=Dryococelus australis TaxID=614101 RepID=A0ABQ9GXF5_9NEOP|nr:hypothetical protein PR048_021144 [Dryococelus australis]